MTKVLFVDDEPVLLRSIERIFKTRGASLHASFATSGAAALDLLERDAFDIIVSDLSMPQMDGVTLLGKVRTRFPQMTRLALSGQSAIAESARAVRVVHQWIAKPCDLRVLCANLERLAWVRGLIDDPSVLARTSELASLPSPPKLFLQVNEALARAAGIREVVRLIETDPAVVAKLLQLVNSAFFGDAERVTSVERAVALLGTDTIRGLLLGAEVFRSGEAAGPLASHSLFVASLARVLAPGALSGDAFVAGILHDIGELIVEGAAERDTPVLHARTGGLLLAMWGLPSEVVTAVAFHHDPLTLPPPAHPLVNVVALAEALATELQAPGEQAERDAFLTTFVSPTELTKARELAARMWHERPSAR